MKSKIYVLLALSAMSFLAQAQTMSNSATAITLTSTCFSVPNGTYTATVSYSDIASTAFPPLPVSVSHSATVSTSGSVITIDAGGVMALFPTLASTGYYSLTDCRNGVIALTSGASTYYLNWDSKNIYCMPYQLADTGLTATAYVGQPTWGLLYFQGVPGSGSHMASTTLYRSTDGGASYYQINTALGWGFSNGNYIDKNPGATNKYFVVGLTTYGSEVYSKVVSFNCAACSFTPPTPVNLPGDSLRGVSTICSFEEIDTCTRSSGVGYVDNVQTWTVTPAYLTIIRRPSLTAPPVIQLIRNNTGTGLVTVKLQESDLTNFYTKTILVGLPTTANIHSNCLGGDCNVYCDQYPNLPDSAYHWTLNLGTHGGLSYYTGQSVELNPIPCNTSGSLSVKVNMACGQVNQGGYIVSNTMHCAGVFTVTPNPATTSATISSKSVTTTIRGVEIYDKNGNRRFAHALRNVSRATINLSGLPADNYVLKITSSTGEVETQQLQILK